MELELEFSVSVICVYKVWGLPLPLAGLRRLGGDDIRLWMPSTTVFCSLTSLGMINMKRFPTSFLWSLHGWSSYNDFKVLLGSNRNLRRPRPRASLVWDQVTVQTPSTHLLNSSADMWKSAEKLDRYTLPDSRKCHPSTQNSMYKIPRRKPSPTSQAHPEVSQRHISPWHKRLLEHQAPS